MLLDLLLILYILVQIRWTVNGYSKDIASFGQFTFWVTVELALLAGVAWFQLWPKLQKFI